MPLAIPIALTLPEHRIGQRLCFWSGVILYLISFFLPAVNRMTGWRCALRSLNVLILHAGLSNPFGLLVLASGLTNPALAAYA